MFTHLLNTQPSIYVQITSIPNNTHRILYIHINELKHSTNALETRAPALSPYILHTGSSTASINSSTALLHSTDKFQHCTILTSAHKLQHSTPHSIHTLQHSTYALYTHAPALHPHTPHNSSIACSRSHPPG